MVRQTPPIYRREGQKEMKTLKQLPLKSYREIAHDCFYPEDLKYGEEAFKTLSTTKEWINKSDLKIWLTQKREEAEDDELYGPYSCNICDAGKKIIDELLAELTEEGKKQNE